MDHHAPTPETGQQHPRGVTAALIGLVLLLWASTSAAQFSIQVGAFSERHRADTAAAAVAELGHPTVHVLAPAPATSAPYRVVLGPYRSHAAARRALHELQQRGLAGFIRASAPSEALAPTPPPLRQEPVAPPAPAPLPAVQTPPSMPAPATDNWHMALYMGLRNQHFTDLRAPDEQLQDLRYLFYNPRVSWHSADRRWQLRLEPEIFVYSRESQGFAIDLREAALFYQIGAWRLGFGLQSIFWGNAEADNPVDVINPVDLQNGAYVSASLGLPMLSAEWSGTPGALALLVMPRFRAVRFPTDGQRWWYAAPGVDFDTPDYESADGERHLDIGLRWSAGAGDLEWAISHFAGTDREARFRPSPDPALGGAIRAHYRLIDQSGLELLHAGERTLVRLEAARVSPRREPGFYRAAAGVEYDIGVALRSRSNWRGIVEYHRSDEAGTATGDLQDDLVIGLRYEANDRRASHVNAGCAVDRVERRNRYCHLDLGTRLSDNWRIGLAGWHFDGDEPAERAIDVRRQNQLLLELSYRQ